MISFEATQPQPRTDFGILEEITSMLQFNVLVEHQGQWVRAGQHASLKEARRSAVATFQRCKRSVVVRNAEGQTLLSLEPVQECAAQETA